MLKNKTLRNIFLVLITLNIVVILVQLLRYPAILSIKGSLPYIITPIVLFIVYSIFTVWITKNPDTERLTVLFVGSKIGFICGIFEILHLIQENFLHFGSWDAIVNIASMIILFLLWAIASLLVVRKTGSIVQGLLAAWWAVVVSFTIGVLFGFIQEFYIHVPTHAEVIIWAEYTRSGWKDTKAFAIANTLDSATTHLEIGPVVAMLFGVIAGVIGKLSKKSF